MTSGAPPRYAATPYAQWIRARLKELGWQKQDFAVALAKKAGKRLTSNGVGGVVHRATVDGKVPGPENRRLISDVLGPEPETWGLSPEDRLAKLEELVAENRSLIDDSLPAIGQRLDALEEALGIAKPQSTRKRKA